MAASSRMANFTAAPPAGRNSARYSRSITDSQSASGSGGVVSTSIGWFQDEANGVVVVLLAGFVEQGQPFATLPPGGPTEFEAASVAVRRVGLPVQPQQVGDEFLLRIVSAGGRQQSQQIMQVRQRNQGTLARLAGTPRRILGARLAVVEHEQAVEELACVEPLRPLLQRLELGGDEARPDAFFQ